MRASIIALIRYQKHSGLLLFAFDYKNKTAFQMFLMGFRTILFFVSFNKGKKNTCYSIKSNRFV